MARRQVKDRLDTRCVEEEDEDISNHDNKDHRRSQEDDEEDDDDDDDDADQDEEHRPIDWRLKANTTKRFLLRNGTRQASANAARYSNQPLAFALNQIGLSSKQDEDNIQR